MGQHGQLPPFIPRVDDVIPPPMRGHNIVPEVPTIEPSSIHSSKSTDEGTRPQSAYIASPSAGEGTMESNIRQRKRLREDDQDGRGTVERARITMDTDVVVPHSPQGSDIGGDLNVGNVGTGEATVTLADDYDAMDLVAEADSVSSADVPRTLESPRLAVDSDEDVATDSGIVHETPTTDSNTTIPTTTSLSEEGVDTPATQMDTVVGPLPAGSPYATSNYLDTRYPTIAAQWSPRNHPLTPDTTLPSSTVVVWWDCPATTCGCKHEWKSSVSARVRQYTKSTAEAAGDQSESRVYQLSRRPTMADCPFCRGVAVCPHDNLAVHHPELAEYWDTAANGGLAMSDIRYPITTHLSWRCEPSKRQHHHCQHPHVWRTRPRPGMKCPYCWENGNRVCPCQSLTHLYPELGVRYRGKVAVIPGVVAKVDATLRIPLNTVSIHNRRSPAWWECEHGHRTKAMIPFIVAKYIEIGRFYCSKCEGGEGEDGSVDGMEATPPTVEDVTSSSAESIPLTTEPSPHTDPDALAMPPPPPRRRPTTDEVDIIPLSTTSTPPPAPTTVPLTILDLTITDRYRSPYRVTVSSVLPELVKQWSPRNGALLPSDIPPSSVQKVWWICNDAPCGCPHHWRASVSSRCELSDDGIWSVTKPECPKCDDRRSDGCSHTSIVTTHPHLAKIWYYSRNSNKNVRPTRITSRSTRVVWWKCVSPQKDCKCDHTWQESVASQAERPVDQACPYCNGSLICSCKDLRKRYPEIARQLQGGDKLVSVQSITRMMWKCDKGHTWMQSPRERVSDYIHRKVKCPKCSE